MIGALLGTRRRRSGTALLLAALTVALVVTSCRDTDPISSGSTPERISDGPNIILISTDDQALFEMRWMPVTRRVLGRSGVTFKNFTAPQPLCCPARAQILTGQYAQNNGVWANHGAHGGYPSLEHPESTLPVWLSDVGYRTSFVGKYLNGYQSDLGIPPGWDDWDATVGVAYRRFKQYDGESVTEPGGYHTDYVTDRTVDEIERLGDDDRPFFMWSSYYAPHGLCDAVNEVNCSTPPVVAPRFARKFAHVRAPFLDKPSFNEADVTDKPRFVTKHGRVDADRMQRLFLERIRALQTVDRGVARIVAALRRTGELDNTVIAFTSDNGWLYGEHRYSGKTLLYEEALRVPLLMRGPGIPRNALRGRTAAMTDLAPTFADLAGAEPLVTVDGESLVPAFREDSVDDRTLLVQEGLRVEDRVGWQFRGVRTDRYTLVYWPGNGFVELYDRRRDPYEIDNVADDPAYADVLEELARRTRELGACSGDSCRTDYGPVPPPLR